MLWWLSRFVKPLLDVGVSRFHKYNTIPRFFWFFWFLSRIQLFISFPTASGNFNPVYITQMILFLKLAKFRCDSMVHQWTWRVLCIQGGSLRILIHLLKSSFEWIKIKSVYMWSRLAVNTILEERGSQSLLLGCAAKSRNIYIYTKAGGERMLLHVPIHKREREPRLFT